MSDIHFIWHVRAANPRIFHWMLFPPALLFIDHGIWSQRVYFFGWSRAPGPLPISFISARLPTFPITGWTRLFVYRYTYTMKEQLLSAVCVYAAQFVGRNRFYLIIKACMNHEFSMSGDFRHFLSPIRCFCSLFRRMPNISFLASALCIPDPSDFMGRQFHAPSEAGKQKFVCIYNILNLIFVQRKK